MSPRSLRSSTSSESHLSSESHSLLRQSLAACKDVLIAAVALNLLAALAAVIAAYLTMWEIPVLGTIFGGLVNWLLIYFAFWLTPSAAVMALIGAALIAAVYLGPIIKAKLKREKSIDDDISAVIALPLILYFPFAIAGTVALAISNAHGYSISHVNIFDTQAAHEAKAAAWIEYEHGYEVSSLAFTTTPDRGQGLFKPTRSFSAWGIAELGGEREGEQLDINYVYEVVDDSRGNRYRVDLLGPPHQH